MKRLSVVILVIIIGMSLAKLQTSAKNGQSAAHLQAVGSKTTTATAITTTTSTSSSSSFASGSAATATSAKMTNLKQILFWTPKKLRYTLGNFTGTITLSKIIEEYAKEKKDLFTLLPEKMVTFNELFSTPDANKFNLTYDWTSVNSLQLIQAVPAIINSTVYNESIGMQRSPLTDIAIQRTIRHIRNCKRGFVLKRFRGKDINKQYITLPNNTVVTSKVFMILLATCRNKNDIEIFSFAAKKSTAVRQTGQPSDSTKKLSTWFIVRWLAANFKNIFTTCPNATAVIKPSCQKHGGNEKSGSGSKEKSGTGSGKKTKEGSKGKTKK